MDTAALTLALGAGALAALNPCGFALLPAWLTLLVGRDELSRTDAVWRALGLSAAMTAGFVAVFGAFGAVVVPLSVSLERYLPWATIVVGVLLVTLGLYLASGRELSVRLPHWRRVPTRGWPAMVAYGAAYALASLSCTAAPFIAILAVTGRSSGVLAGLAVVLAYAAGMGLLVGVLALAVALAQDTVIQRMRALLPVVGRLGGVLVAVAGAYVVWYGLYEVRVFGGGSTDDAIVDAAVGVQGALAAAVDRVGPLGLATALLVGLLMVGLAVVVPARRRGRTRSGRNTPM
ncbi:MAG: cytochrome c biogenesis protein CcdA [Lapillicoccus sp.]